MAYRGKNKLKPTIAEIAAAKSVYALALAVLILLAWAFGLIRF
jgi:hypothetical protein